MAVGYTITRFLEENGIRNDEENDLILSRGDGYDSRTICPPMETKIARKIESDIRKRRGGGKRGVGIWRITSTRCVIVNAAPRYRGLEELREKNFRLAREEKAFARRIERKIGKWFIASFAREIRCIFATVRFRWPGFYLHTGFLIKFPPSFDYGPIPAENFIETLRYLLRYDKHSLRN